MSSLVALVSAAVRLLPMKRTLALAVTSRDERSVSNLEALPQAQRMQSRTGAAVRARSFIGSPGRRLEGRTARPDDEIPTKRPVGWTRGPTL